MEKKRKLNKRTDIVLYRPIILLLMMGLILIAIQCWQLNDRLSKKDEEIHDLQVKYADLLKKQKAAETGKESETSKGETESESNNASSEEMVNINIEELEAGTMIAPEDIDTENLVSYFSVYEISDKIFERIDGKSYRENDNIKRSDLRYLKVIHYNFDHNIQVGELIVNALLAEDCLEIFQQLFEAEYEINSIYLIDNYWTGDGETSDNASIEANNTSAFCYRTMSGSSSVSNHAYGCAIDINPQQNPYVAYENGKPVWNPANAADYIERISGTEHVITHDDLCYKVFAEHGFSWGGDWNNPKDYQHFEKKVDY